MATSTHSYHGYELALHHESDDRYQVTIGINAVEPKNNGSNSFIRQPDWQAPRGWVEHRARFHDVRFTPESGHSSTLFNHLIGEYEQLPPRVLAWDVMWPPSDERWDE